jgi:hypothetical protein
LHIIDDLAFRLFGRLIAQQFVVFGGIPAVLERGAKLRARGITPTYNRIDEHVRGVVRVNEICASYVALVLAMDHTNHGNVAIKPSAFGMELGATVFSDTLREFIGQVRGHKLEIEIDAENRETLALVQRVLNALYSTLPSGIIFRPAFQMHLPSALRDEMMKNHRIMNMPLRIVKGSGLYSLGLVEADEQEVDANYVDTFLSQVSDGRHPNVATVRDRRLLEVITSIAAAHWVAPHEFTLQFLAGPFGRSLVSEYVARGYCVGCYVPFVDPTQPDEWRGYVKRRITFGRKLIFG